MAAGLAAGCGAHRTSMNEAVLRHVCGDVCGHRQVRLTNVRHAGNYATAEVTSIPPGRVQGDHVLLQRVDGDWRFIDAWSSLGGLTCADVARQMRVPETILHRLGVC